jgi:uncharacterized protein (DUF1778 family)
MPVAAKKTSRLVARLPQKLRATIQEAADMEGTSLNQFVIRAAHKQAQEILERERIVRLNREETKRIFDLMDNPPKPTAAMLKAKALHRKTIRAEN